MRYRLSLLAAAAMALAAAGPALAQNAPALAPAAPPPPAIFFNPNVTIFDSVSRENVAAVYAIIDLARVNVVTPDKTLDPCAGPLINMSVTRTVGHDDLRPLNMSWQNTSAAADLAINGGYFDPITRFNTAGYLCRKIVGYTVNNATLIEPEPSSRRIKAWHQNGVTDQFASSTLLFYTQAGVSIGGRYADIFDVMGRSPQTRVANNVRHAVSGLRLISDGAYVGDFNIKQRRTSTGSGPDAHCPLPRTAVGLRRDYQTLVIVVVNNGDNNSDCNPFADTGITLKGLAQYMTRQLDVFVAVNLDGGGSAQLFALLPGHRFQTAPSDPKDWDGTPAPPGKKFYRLDPGYLGFNAIPR